MSTLAHIVTSFAAGFALLLLSTLMFDVLHLLLHRFAASSQPLLAALGNLHQVHHRFLDRHLRLHREYIAANVWCHVIPEFGVQVLVTLALGYFFPRDAVIVALALETLVFVLIMKPTPGFDINHHPVERLKAYRPLYFCVPEYHLLHHAYPDAHFSSWIKTVDHLCGTGLSLKGRTVALSASANAAGRYFERWLLAQGAQCLVLSTRSASADLLRRADILLLCHDIFSESDHNEWIKAFYQLHQSDRIPVEVWVLSTEDALPAVARRWYGSERLIYRQLLLPAQPDAADFDQLGRRLLKGYNWVVARWSFTALRTYGRLVRK